MSAPPFFQSAGRGSLLFWGEKERPMEVMWESAYQNKKRQVGWKRQARLGRVVQVKKGAEEIRSFELSRKEIFSNYDEAI